MIRKMVSGLMKAGNTLKNVLSMAALETGEMQLLNRCLREVGEKRQKALEKKRRNDARARNYITTWAEDDRYANDLFYQKKLEECYDRYTKMRNKILPLGR